MTCVKCLIWNGSRPTRYSPRSWTMRSSALSRPVSVYASPQPCTPPSVLSLRKRQVFPRSGWTSQVLIEVIFTRRYYGQLTTVSTGKTPCVRECHAPLFLRSTRKLPGVGAMPRFQPLSQERIAELTTRRGPGQVDLSEHKRWIEDAIRNANGWGEIGIEPSDNVRAIKRRTTIAGKEMNRTIK